MELQVSIKGKGYNKPVHKTPLVKPYIEFIQQITQEECETKEDFMNVLHQVIYSIENAFEEVYPSLELFLRINGIRQKELCDVLALSPQNINRRIQGKNAFRQLEKQVLYTHLKENYGYSGTIDELFITKK